MPSQFRLRLLLFLTVFGRFGSPFLQKSAFVTRPCCHFSQRDRSSLSPKPIHQLALSHESAQLTTNLLHSYESLLRVHPITTKSVTSALLSSVGDAIAQVRSRTKGDDDVKYDIQRGLCFLLFGAFYTGAFQHFWFQFLGNHVSSWGEALKFWGPNRASIPVEDIYSLKEWWMYFDVVGALENPPSPAALAAGKLAVNQFFMIPFFYMPLFFALTGWLANLNPEESIARAKTMYFSLLKRNYFYWLPMQFIQFLVIPPDWQIPFLSTASLVWTVILSSIAGSSETSSQTQTVASVSETQGDDFSQELVSSAQVESVSLEDVENTLIPEAARDVLSDPKVGATTAGGFVALLMAAADDGIMGELVGGMLGARVDAGVAAVTAIGAALGLFVATGADQEATENKEQEKADLEELSLRPEKNMTVLPGTSPSGKQRHHQQRDNVKEEEEEALLRR